jgi:hypothetical protein
MSKDIVIAGEIGLLAILLSSSVTEVSSTFTVSGRLIILTIFCFLNNYVNFVYSMYYPLFFVGVYDNCNKVGRYCFWVFVEVFGMLVGVGETD